MGHVNRETLVLCEATPEVSPLGSGYGGLLFLEVRFPFILGCVGLGSHRADVTIIR